MNLKKPISAAMAAVMTLSVTATPALAAAEDPPGTATQADETNTDATLGDQSSAEEDTLNSSDTSEKSHQDAKVYASANGSYILTVPESINLHNIEKKDLGSGLYTNDKNCKVNLRGDVRQDQVVVVTVTEPVMQSEGSKDVDATVDTSSKTVWSRDDMFTGATAGEDGSYTEPTGVTTIYPVSAELTPGDWVGTAMFNCSLETASSIASVVTGIDPAGFDYDGQEHTPGLIFADGSSLVEGKDYVISGDTAKVDEGDYTLTVTGAGKYIGSTSFAWKIKKYDISTAVSGLDNTVFEEDETTHSPNIAWRDGFDLKEGVDYEVSGTTSASDAGDYTITVTGKGKYKGTIDLEWKVAAKPDIALAVSGITPVHFDYDGDSHFPTLIWNEGYENLAEGQDYTISGDIIKSENGNYTLTVTGKGKYKGTANFDWNIGELIPVGAVYTISSTGEQLIGDGISVCFPLTATYGDTYIDENQDYTYCCRYNNSCSDYPNGWAVAVNDTSKSSYGALRSYICDKSVTDMAATFMDCSNMTVAPVIPDSVIWMGIEGGNADSYGTFKNCQSLIKSPNIPSGVTSMVSCFEDCSLLEEAPIIPDSVESMYSTFENCTSLTEAPVIPDGVTDMDSTFSGCTSLKTYTGSTDPDGDFSDYKIPDDVTNMYETFRGCTSIVKAPILGSSVTNMNSTFRNCTSLTEAPVIHSSVTDMRYTFSGCTSLTGTLTCNANPTSYSNALRGTKITAVEGSCSEDTKEKLSVTIGKAFVSTNEALKVLPYNTVYTVAATGEKISGDNKTVFPEPAANDTFDCGDYIYTYNRSGRNGYYGTEWSVRLASDKMKESSVGNIVGYIGSKPVTNMFGCFIESSIIVPPAIPDTVTDISGAFECCYNLTEVPIIPDSVTKMWAAFYDCSSLTIAPEIPASVTNMKNAFEGCSSLAGALVCDANPTEYSGALSGTKITSVEGSCSEETKAALLATK